MASLKSKLKCNKPKRTPNHPKKITCSKSV